ncbi:F-box only protein 11 [Culex quinquefasciatus]|uniref:F-box only protein 11 n=1 Tax=Culex quinquefasciatus TaxID=7176 RepID=B0XDQ7_CULQU|nr:F-box only protein 11 [Culex quinquefasciatus]|eukprot:XP_001867779.1 F-box only protein 11 [Culex quinquefasciatus]
MLKRNKVFGGRDGEFNQIFNNKFGGLCLASGVQPITRGNNQVSSVQNRSEKSNSSFVSILQDEVEEAVSGW